MEVVDALIHQIEHLLSRHRGGDEAAGLHVVLQPLEPGGQPVGHRGAGAAGEVRRLLEVLHRQDARDDRDRDPGGPDLLQVAQVDLVLEEELGDRLIGAGIDLGLQGVDVGVQRGRLGMLLGVGRDRDLEVADPLDPLHQFGGRGVAFRMGPVGVADALGRVAAQGHDVAHARVPVGLHHRVDLVAGGVHAGEVGGGLEAGLADHPGDRVVGALAGRAAGPVGHRDEARLERREALDGVPEDLLHLVGLRREELDRDADRVVAVAAGAVGGAAHRSLVLYVGRFRRSLRSSMSQATAR